jgi:hypothetical protein
MSINEARGKDAASTVNDFLCGVATISDARDAACGDRDRAFLWLGATAVKYEHVLNQSIEIRQLFVLPINGLTFPQHRWLAISRDRPILPLVLVSMLSSMLAWL